MQGILFFQVPRVLEAGKCAFWIFRFFIVHSLPLTLSFYPETAALFLPCAELRQMKYILDVSMSDVLMMLVSKKYHGFLTAIQVYTPVVLSYDMVTSYP